MKIAACGQSPFYERWIDHLVERDGLADESLVQERIMHGLPISLIERTDMAAACIDERDRGG